MRRIEGVWVLLGCYYFTGGDWLLERDYIYAPYWELWEFGGMVMTLHGYDCSTRYPYTIKGDDTITCPASCMFEDGKRRRHAFRIRFIEHRLYLVQMRCDAVTPDRVYVMERTGWNVGLPPEKQTDKVRRLLDRKRKIHWLDKDESGKLALIELSEGGKREAAQTAGQKSCERFGLNEEGKQQVSTDYTCPEGRRREGTYDEKLRLFLPKNYS